MTPFSSVPFFRLLIPLVAGIFFSLHSSGAAAAMLWPGIALGLSLLLWLLEKIEAKLKLLFLITVDVFLFFTGYNLVVMADESKLQTHYEHVVTPDSVYTWQAVVNEMPVQKTRFVKCEVSVRALKLEHGFVPVCGKVLAYFRNGPAANAIRPGQLLLIESAFTKIQSPLNPGEFDYKRYLNDKQIFKTTFVDSTAFKRIRSGGSINPLKEWALKIKIKILESLRGSGLSNTAFAICSALLTGYDDEIGQSVTEAFSHSGTLHVLSVSGLHTGMIYLVLNFFLQKIDPKNRFRRLRFVIVNVSLWSFALITGFSAPVLRAVIMFSLFSAGKLFSKGGEAQPMNVLAASAFILLLYNPFYVRDVGFILSFSALGGILYFQPPLAALWNPSSYLLKQAWSSMTASFAATIGTLPITLYYFKQFPYWFMVCNLVVVPLSFVLLLMGLLIVLKLGVLVWPANWLINLLSAFISLFDSPEWGYADNIDFSGRDSIFMTLLIILVSLALKQRHSGLLTASLFALILWQMSSLVFSFEAKYRSLFIVSNIRKQECIIVKNHTKVYLYYSDIAALKYHLRNELISFNHPEIETRSFNFGEVGDENFVLLNKKNYWPDTVFSEVKTIVLGNNFRLRAEHLSEFPNLRRVIADGSNSLYSLRRAEELCRKFGLDFYSTANNGAYIKETNEITDRRQGQVFE